jgi:hypothetical protein
MVKLHYRSRTLLGAVIGAAVLILPATALADCVDAIGRAANKGGGGTITQWYPQQCYSTTLKKLGPDFYTYAPNVVRNVKAAMRRDRTRKLKFTIAWLPKSKVRVTSNYPLKSGIQLRKGARVLTKGSISSKSAVLRLRKTTGRLTVALIWKLGKKTITVTKPATLAKVVKKK